MRGKCWRIHRTIRIHRVLIAALLFLISVIHADAKIRIDKGKETFFIGDSLLLKDSLFFYGTMFNPDMTKVNGLFTDDLDIKLCSKELPDGTIIYQDKLYHLKKYSYTTIYRPGKLYEEYMDDFLQIKYDFTRKKWITYNYAYDTENSHAKEEITDSQDRICIFLLRYLVYPFVFIAVIRIALSWFIRTDIFSDPVLATILSVPVLIGAIFLPDDYVYGVLIPCMVFLLVSGISILIKRSGIRTAARLSAAVLFILLMSDMYVFTKDFAKLSDGTKIPVTWQKGTDPVKRHVIKNILSNLVMIPGSDQYMCRFELRRYEADIIMGEVMGWGSMARPDEVMDCLSFQDANVLIRKLRELTGNSNITLPSAETWAKAVSKEDSRLFTRFDELQKVGNGSPNHLGLYDMEGNVPEWTSSEVRNMKISRQGQSLYDRSYAMLAGGCYNNNHFNIAQTPKGLWSMGSGVRIAYGRQREARSRITAILQDSVKGLPRHGILTEINGKGIKNLGWDTVYELLIAGSSSDRTYRIMERDTVHKKNIWHNVRVKANTEPYHFYPATIP